MLRKKFTKSSGPRPTAKIFRKPPAPVAPPLEIGSSLRIHKLLANRGLGSRRAIEEWIKQGKIQVNGKDATIGQVVTLRDRIHVNGRPISFDDFAQQTTRVLLYHKPEGEICSRSREDVKQTVFDNLPSLKQGKWIAIGRLDVNTAGLLLFTNNGTLAHQLMHPSFLQERQYAVRVLGKVTPEIIHRLKDGVKLEDGVFRFKDIEQKESTGANQWFHVTLMEGKYREVRRLWESQHCLVSRLIRIKFGQFELPKRLRKGDYQELPVQEVQELMSD